MVDPHTFTFCYYYVCCIVLTHTETLCLSYIIAMLSVVRLVQ